MLDEKKKIISNPYSIASGNLIYVMICARLDIAYIVGLVSRYESNLGLAYWKALNMILHYLKETIHHSLSHIGHDLLYLAIQIKTGLLILSNAGPLLEYIFLSNEGVISWASKKQTCIALPT